MSDRLVIFQFSGRQANMSVQWPYLSRILTDYPEAELHLWDLTREASDARYLTTLEGAHEGRVRVLRNLHHGHPIKCLYPPGARPRMRGYPPCSCMMHKPLFEKPYQWYAERPEYEGATFVKMDDDVLFLETHRFEDLIAPLTEHPNRIISANVINNSVCAKYLPNNAETANKFAVGEPSDPLNDKRWWALHELGAFAQWMHDWFLDGWADQTNWDIRPTEYVRTRPGEAVSINCIAFTYQTMLRLAKSFQHEPRLGDEGVVDRLLPWICLSFHAAHLTFGPQDKEMGAGPQDALRHRYDQLRKEYLGECLNEARARSRCILGRTPSSTAPTFGTSRSTQGLG